MALAADDSALVVATAMGKATDSVEKLAVAMSALDDKHVSVTASVSGISGPVAGLIAQVEAAKAAMAGLGSTSVRVSADVAGLGTKTAAAGAAAGAGMRIWGTGIRLTGQALHWLVMGTLEVASTAIPAILALGAAGAGMFGTFVHISDTIHNLVVASGSMSGAMRNSVGPVAALSSHMGSLAASMAPDAYIIFGSVIQDLTGSFGSFSGVAQRAGTVLAGFATKITQDLQGPAGAQLAGFFQNSVKYMIQWGQVLGNLGHAFLNTVNAMWGVGQILLDVLVALSRAFLAVTSNPVAAWLIGVAAAMSALYRYSKLMVTVWNLLGGSAIASAIKGAVAYASALAALAAEEGVVAAASLALGDLMSVALGPVGIAIAAVTTVLGVWYLASRSAGDATDRLISQVQKAPPTVANLTSGIGKLRGALDASSASLHSMAGQAATAHSAVADLTRGGVNALAAQASQAKGDIGKLTAAITKQEMELLNLDIGLAQAGAGTGAVAAGENALAISTALADSKVQQLNQALDQYMQLVTGGTAGLAAFTNSLANIGTVAGNVRNNLGKSTVQMSLNARQFSQALSDMGAKGASAWTNLDQVLGSTMPQMMDWFRQAAQLGATTGKVVSQAALDMTAQIMKYAGSNKTAQAEVLAFAQAQGLAVTSWAALKAAVRAQGAGQADLTKKVDATTIALGNLSAMARNTSAALNAQVSNALATAALKASKFQTDITNAAQAMSTHMEVGGKTAAEWLALADQAQNKAAADAIKMAQNMSTSAGQAGAAGKQIATAADNATTAFDRARTGAMNLQTVIDSMHGTNLVIGVQTVYSSSGVPTYGVGAPGHVKLASGTGPGGAKPGAALVGEEGPELMWMRGGEHVLPAGPTAAVMHMAGAVQGARGYAHGTTTFEKLLHLLERDFRLIENGLRINLKRPEGVWFPSLIKAVEEIKRDFKRHLITKEHELELLKLAEARNKRLEGIAAHHVESRDLTALANLFAPKHHAPKMIGPIADLLKQVEREHGAGVIGKAEEMRLTRLLKHDNARLEDLQRKRSRILAKLHDAEAHYLAEVKAEHQYAASVTSAAESSASLSTILGGASGPVSSSYLLASMRIDLSQIRRFDADIKKLEKLGLDKNLLNQIIQMGPAQGDPVAQALINGPLSNIRALNRTEAHITAASRHLGQSTSREMYGAGINAARGLVKGLEHEQKQIDKVMEKVARDMVKTLRRELGISHHHGPVQKIGHAAIDALAGGVSDRGPSLDASLRTAAGHVPSALGSAARVPVGGGSLEVVLPVTVMLDGKVLTRTVQTRSLRADRRNGANNLSLRRGRGQ